ncbi:MAG: serine/threonine protein kinase [Pirellulales bacterium]|nr:serine/threonine protein kinase [Pirellulales bacterium]
MPLLDSLKKMLAGRRTNVSTRFALLREGIQGTMSSFYMARDLRTNQIVGLKILDPKKNAEFEARFKGLEKPSEGEISAQLEHPRIVKTLEFGLTTQGEQYLVMEFLDGPTLHSALIGQDPAFEGRRVRFLREAAEAVAAVHAAGYIHRDICPRNFILTDEGEHVKLIDFGLTVPATKLFMQPGNRTGTPNYMAPELVRRRATDFRLDVFAFGVTAYEICTFELPWTRGTTGMAAMGHDKPPADIRQYRPQIHPLLAHAIHACIEPNVARRCPSMEKFLQMIHEVKHEDAEREGES